jgi:hypothetical protein
MARLLLKSLFRMDREPPERFPMVHAREKKAARKLRFGFRYFNKS